MIREVLRRVDIEVVSHKEMGWKHDMKDVAIINECAARNFLILSGDKAMSRVPEERQAIINGRCKVFMFDDSHKTRTEDWIASFLIGRERIFEIVTKTRGPLFVTIKPSRRASHVGLPDFVAANAMGGGWLGENETLPITVPDLEHLPGKVRPSSERQRKLFEVEDPNL